MKHNCKFLRFLAKNELRFEKCETFQMYIQKSPWKTDISPIISPKLQTLCLTPCYTHSEIIPVFTAILSVLGAGVGSSPLHLCRNNVIPSKCSQSGTALQDVNNLWNGSCQAAAPPGFRFGGEHFSGSAWQGVRGRSTPDAGKFSKFCKKIS